MIHVLFDPGMLVTGPRGRRLCLQLALAGEGEQQADELHRSVFHAVHELDPGRGYTRVLFGGGSGEYTCPRSSPAEVAHLLDSVPLSEPHERALVHALAEAVNSARYWQEPDGEDVLAATTELRDALASVAAKVARCEHAAWWTTPIARAAQWSVTFPDVPGSTGGGSAVERLLRWREKAVEDEIRACRERARDPEKPISGAWWSTPPVDLLQTTRSLGGLGPAGLWFVEDGMGWDRATARHVTVRGEATVYEVDGHEAWAALCRRHPLEVTASRRHDWYRTTGRHGRWVVPDWTRVARDFDAVHLTVAGYLATAGCAVPVADDVATVLAGWNPDETYWLTDVAWANSSQHEWSDDDGAGWTLFGA